MKTSVKFFTSIVLCGAALSSAFAYSPYSEKPYAPKTNANPVALYSQEQLSQGFAACPQNFPPGTTLSEKSVAKPWQAKELCSNDFAVLYSQLSKTPLVTVERLNRSHLGDAKGLERSDDFYPDPRVSSKGRAVLADYKSVDRLGKHYDRGHMSPAADQSSESAMHQSFALSNMVPQDPVNNRKIWNKIEQDVRKYALRASGDVYVFSGPLFDEGHQVIGRNNVWVPTRLFKLVYDQSTGKSWAYIIANAEVPIDSPVDYPTFVRLTGWNFLK